MMNTPADQVACLAGRATDAYLEAGNAIITIRDTMVSIAAMDGLAADNDDAETAELAKQEIKAIRRDISRLYSKLDLTVKTINRLEGV